MRDTHTDSLGSMLKFALQTKKGEQCSFYLDCRVKLSTKIMVRCLVLTSGNGASISGLWKESCPDAEVFGSASGLMWF